MFKKFNNWYDGLSEIRRASYFILYSSLTWIGLYAPYIVLNVIGLCLFIPLLAVAISRI